MKKLLVVVLTILMATYSVPLMGADTVCKVGADPVDTTYTWVPPTEWRLVKTNKPQEVTQKGGRGEYTCVLPAGEVIAYPPDGGNPVVVLCKNEITKGRPTGTEIPRAQLTRQLEILASGKIDLAGDINVHHSGDINVHHDGTIKIDAPPPPTTGWCGVFRTNKGCNWATGILVVIGTGVVMASSGGGSSSKGPDVTTLPPSGKHLGFSF